MSLVDCPKHIWALYCMIACRFRMALTASFAAESSRCEDSFCEDSRKWLEIFMTSSQ
ncbi:hypothetical protein Tco_1579131, partial [Tanacetum coccineum]